MVKCNLESSATRALQWFDKNGMPVNVSKLQVIVMNSSHSDQKTTFDILEKEIANQSVVKMLGFLIDDKLKFDDHVSMLCLKASRQVSAMRRISKYFDTKSRFHLYNDFIMSNFTYCSNIWFFGRNGNVLKLENVHKRALRIALNDYTSSYCELLDKAKRPSIYVSGLRSVMLEFYKYINDVNPPILGNIFVKVSHQYNTRNSQKVIQPKVNTTSNGLNSFRYQGPRLWNLLPNTIKCASSVQEFKSLITQWNGPSCSCGSCTLCKIGCL